VSGRSVQNLGEGAIGLLRSLYAFAVTGAPWGLGRMGVVTAIGVNYAVNGDRCDGKPFKAQWLPGGCVLCFREDLILDKFYPFPGKAYAEDLIHSFLRDKNGIHQWVIPKAICSIDEPDCDFNNMTIAAQRYVASLRNGSNLRINLYFFCLKLVRLLKRQINNLKNFDK
jgi:hypothetical protein